MYFHLLFVTRGWLYRMAKHYCFQAKLREEERETAELDCPWPRQTDNSAVTYVLVIWEAPVSISEMRHPIQLKLNLVHGFFSLPGKRFGLRRGKGECKSIMQIPKRTISTFPCIRLIYQLENVSLEEGSSINNSLDARFNHARYSYTQDSQTLTQTKFQSAKWGEKIRSPCFARWFIQGPLKNSGSPKLENEAKKLHWQWLMQCFVGWEEWEYFLNR